MNNVSKRCLLMWLLIPALFCGMQVSAADDEPASAGAENASNPLAAVTSTDVRWQYLDLTGDGQHLNDFFVDGAFMVNPKLKVKYELHYWDTNTSGSSEQGLESALVKAIFFPKQGVLSGGTGYRVAMGIDYIHDLGDTDKGIGFGADQVGPFVGIAFGLKSGLSVVPLLQHYTSINGPDINTTALRLIAVQPFNTDWWLKADARVPYDWENETVPATAEFQVGKNISSGKALYVEGLIGLGSDRLYDWGVGVGLRFKY